MRSHIGGGLALSLIAATGAAGAPPADTRTPAAIALQTALERVCLPLIAGKPMKAVAAPAGLREHEGRWTLAVSGEKRVTVTPPTPANPDVCALTLTYDVGHEEPLLSLLDRWARARGLSAVRTREASRGPLRARTTSSWSGETPQGAMAVVISQEKTLDGRPVAEALDQATVLLSLAKS